VNRFVDSGTHRTTTLATSTTLLATGSQSGIVNLYHTDTLQSNHTTAHPTPYRSLPNLTTHITAMTINRDSQVMAIASRVKRDQLRLVHVGTGRVYQNWPTAQTPLGYVQSVAFSPASDYLAIGNDRGRALLYRVHPY
jgi:U3 small nucleolar RNA-associated protein 18